MSALPNDFLHDATRLTEDATRPFPASRKIHVEGSRPDLRVPMREISLTPTRTKDGIAPNAPVTVYDTSGPYTSASRAAPRPARTSARCTTRGAG